MSQDTSQNNKRIAKNTLLLYFRMFITMAIGLYTSRVVLNVLGISDYGIYNVVGGIITSVSFLNAAMVQASQRFLAFELGAGNTTRLNRVFCTSVNIHFSICILAFLIGETVGLWFVNTQLNLPDGRLMAANWVYQASILTFMLGVMNVPFTSAIVAHERMSVYAYISILDVILKLIIVYMLLIIPFDKLVVYGILLALISATNSLCYVFYCKKYFTECRYHRIFDKTLFSEMFSFAGWSVLGNLGFSFKDQISNIILNLFFGTTVNAARGIGLHVTTLVNTFATNFTMALNPQITKQYASGNYEESRKLVYAGCRYSFYLLSIISIPIILNIDYLLKLWLGVVPEYTSQFVIFSLLAALIYVLSGSVTTALQATGRIKWFQIGICIIMLSELPVAWVLLKMGYPPYSAMWPSLATYTLALLFRYWLINRYVPGYSFSYYLFGVVLRCIVLFALSYYLSWRICLNLSDNIIHLLLSFAISVIITFSIYFVLGTYKSERHMLVGKIKQYLYGKK